MAISNKIILSARLYSIEIYLLKTHTLIPPFFMQKTGYRLDHSEVRIFCSSPLPHVCKFLGLHSTRTTTGYSERPYILFSHSLELATSLVAVSFYTISSFLKELIMVLEKKSEE